MKVNLSNLDTLTFRFPGRNGVEQTGYAIYAEPVDKLDPLGPVRQVGDDDEGFSCVDDVARVALVYLEQYEKTHQPLWAEKATQAVKFCLNQEDGEGRFYNFVEKDGKLNTDGPTSKPGLNWWSARAFWALSRAERVLEDPQLKSQIHDSRMRTLDRLHEAHTESLVDRSGSITSLFALGLLENNDDPALLTDYCDAMVGLQVKDHPLLHDLHLNSLGDLTTVHLYGNHQVQALAEAGVKLNRPDWIASAQKEADQYPRMLTSHQLPFAYSPAPEPTPQIAYAAETTIANLQAVYRATGEERYSDLAGLFGTWFAGANVAGQPVYHPPTGRAFDGVDPHGVSTNSGAESNVEAQLAMSALENTPGQKFLGYGHLVDFQGETVRTDFETVAGSPRVHERTLNGGAKRPNLELTEGDRVRVSTHDSLLVWKGALRMDPDGPGPLPEQAVPAAGEGWQTTRLPDSHSLELSGQVTLDSLVDTPEQQHRTWSDGHGTVTLHQDAAGWAIRS